MTVSEFAARQVAISMMSGDPNKLIDAYEKLIGHRTSYEQVHNRHSDSLLPEGHEAAVITKLMGEEQYKMAHAVLSNVVQLMQAGGDGASTGVYKSN